MNRRAGRHAALRTLELKVFRRLDGILQGDHRGLVPGHGSELGEARRYLPGDDVRRIDWNVTARTGEPHVRDTIADRELETTLVVDLSGSMSFGTAAGEKRDVAVGAVGAVGYLTQRGGNRTGALLLDGRGTTWMRHRGGRRHLEGILYRLLSTDRDGGRADLAAGLREAGRLARRRGLVAVASDFLDAGDWDRPLRALARRHDVLVFEVVDPRELELADVGVIAVVDPETGRRRWVDTASPALRARYGAAASAQRQEIGERLRRAGADHLVLRTDRDWVRDLVRHVVRRRGHTTGRRP